MSRFSCRPRSCPASNRNSPARLAESPGEAMFRVFAVLAVMLCAAPTAAEQRLPAGADPQNTILIDTAHGRIVIKLRNDIAPKHAERIKTLTREKFYDNV